MSSELALSGTRQVVLAGCRRTAQHCVTRRAAGLGLAIGGGLLLLGPLRSVLVLSMGVAIGVVAALAALGSLAALLVHQTSRDPQPVPATDAGHRSETSHEDVQVHSVRRLRGGDVSVVVSWRARHSIELDARGLPLGVANEGPGTRSWIVPAAVVPDERSLEQLRLHVDAGLSLVEHGRIGVAGTTVTRRVLASSQGILLDLRC
jgi:hypothetical protein